MTPKDTLVLKAIETIWKQWAPTLRYESHWAGFREHLDKECGVKYRGHDKTDFCYEITDEKKFAWFVLQCSHN